MCSANVKEYLTLLLFSVLLVWFTNGQTFEEVEKLRDLILRNSSASVRPVVNQSDTMLVHVIFSFNGIDNVDELRQELTSFGWINLSWVDQIKTWVPDEHGGVKSLRFDENEIWKPEIMVANSLEDRLAFKDLKISTSVRSDGMVRWYPGAVFRTFCKMIMTKFPFDEHECDLTFMSNIYFKHELQFVPAGNDAAVVEDYERNGEWEVTSSSFSLYFDTIGEDQVFPGFKIRLRLRRQPEYILINVVLPVMLLSLLNFFVCILPSDCGEKVSFGTTVLLSQTMYMTLVAENLPRNSDSMPLLLVYCFILLVLGSLSVVSAIIIVALKEKSRNDHRDSVSLIWLKGFFFSTKSSRKQKERKMLRKETKCFRKNYF